MRISEQRSAGGPGTLGHEFFFTTPALRLRLDLVRDYVQADEAPVLVSGESGSGKSAFLDQIVCRADSCWRLVRIPAVASFTPFEIVSFINTELRLPVGDSMDRMIEELDEFLARVAMRGRIAVIVVDDAHRLAEDALVELVSLGRRLACGNLRLLMTALPELRCRLTALFAGTRAPMRPHVITIPSLDKREVASYIDMKLYHAGVDDWRPFSRSIIDDIAHGSRGHPGRIDAMTDEILSNDRGRANARWTPGCLRRLLSQLSGLSAPR